MDFSWPSRSCAAQRAHDPTAESVRRPDGGPSGTRQAHSPDRVSCWGIVTAWHALIEGAPPEGMLDVGGVSSGPLSEAHLQWGDALRPSTDPSRSWITDRLGPVGRAAEYYARSWTRWLLPLDRPPDMPVPFPSPMLGLGAMLDETLVSLSRILRKPLPVEQYDRIHDEVVAAVDLYRRRGWLDDPLSYFPAPPPANPSIDPESLLGVLGGMTFEHFRFDSGYEPDPEEPGRERWLGYGANRSAHAWVLRHPEPRPWLVCIHGAGMGYPLADMFAFQAAWLHKGLGINLALPVMPLHGPRRGGLSIGPGFPNDDVLDTVHAVAQAVWDTRRLVSWIRSEGSDVVGVAGLSLGGYMTALLAGVEAGLACVIAGVPAVDFGELFERHAPAQVRRRPEFVRMTGETRAAHRVISPLALTPQVPIERRFIFAGLADRLVHPHAQVRALWDHWQRPSIRWFDGSHVGFLWSGAVRGFIRDALSSSGLVDADAA